MGVVEEQVVIQRPSDEVWAVLSDFGNIHRWSPVVNHSEATNEVEGGVGCERRRSRSASNRGAAVARRRVPP